MKLEISENFSLPQEAVTQTFAILAKRGVGKTYAGCVMVEEMLAANHQVVIADPVGVWWGLRSSADGKSAGFPIVVFGGEHGDVPLEEHAGEIVAQAIVENGFSAVLDLSLFRKGQQVRFMTAFAETLYRLNRKPLHFMVDEADEFAPQRPMHGCERLLGAFEDIVRRGRARGLGVTLITQRAAVLNKNVLTQIEVLVVLRTISPQDREAIEVWTEIHGTEKQLQQLSESMASLPIGTAWFWSPGWLDVFKQIKVRQKKTFDSSATPEVGKKVSAPKTLAEVNLDKLGEQIKATADKAKANDPAELKRQLASARKEIAALQTKQPAPKAVGAKRVEVPTLTGAERKRLTKLIEAAEKVSNHLDVAVCRAGGMKQEVAFFKDVLAGRLLLPSPQVAQTIIKPVSRDIVRATVSTRQTATPSQNGDVHLGRCERSILTVLAQYPQGRDVSQVAILSGYSGTSGGFNNALGKLRSVGFITRTNPMQITQEGMAAAGDFDPLPTGRALQAYWLSKLPKCERMILEKLCEIYPESATSEQVGEATGYSSSSGGFNNALGKLRTLELINRGQPIRANENLFE
jgi:hypothetical protein